MYLRNDLKLNYNLTVLIVTKRLNQVVPTRGEVVSHLPSSKNVQLFAASLYNIHNISKWK